MLLPSLVGLTDGVVTDVEGADVVSSCCDIEVLSTTLGGVTRCVVLFTEGPLVVVSVEAD